MFHGFGSHCMPHHWGGFHPCGGYHSWYGGGHGGAWLGMATTNTIFNGINTGINLGYFLKDMFGSNQQQQQVVQMPTMTMPMFGGMTMPMFGGMTMPTMMSNMFGGQQQTSGSWDDFFSAFEKRYGKPFGSLTTTSKAENIKTENTSSKMLELVKGTPDVSTSAGRENYATQMLGYTSSDIAGFDEAIKDGKDKDNKLDIDEFKNFMRSHGKSDEEVNNAFSALSGMDDDEEHISKEELASFYAYADAQKIEKDGKTEFTYDGKMTANELDEAYNHLMSTDKTKHQKMTDALKARFDKFFGNTTTAEGIKAADAPTVTTTAEQTTNDGVNAELHVKTADGKEVYTKDGKYYSDKNGQTLMNGEVGEDMYYQGSKLTKGDDGTLYTDAQKKNKFAGEIDGKIYSDGKPLNGQYKSEEKDGKITYVPDTTNGKHYLNGALMDGAYTTKDDNTTKVESLDTQGAKFYSNGQEITKNGDTYKIGEANYTGTIGGTIINNGKPINGWCTLQTSGGQITGANEVPEGTDGAVYYENGKPLTGVSEGGQYMKDGKVVKDGLYKYTAATATEAAKLESVAAGTEGAVNVRAGFNDTFLTTAKNDQKIKALVNSAKGSSTKDSTIQDIIKNIPNTVKYPTGSSSRDLTAAEKFALAELIKADLNKSEQK